MPEIYPMQDPYLIQVLEAPAKTEWHHDVAMAFGGRMLQVSDEAWKLLRPICSFHYMGAAEFEFGALPKCFSRIAGAADKLVSFSFVIKAKDIPPNYDRERRIEIMRRTHNKQNRLLREKGEKTKRFKPPPPGEDVKDRTVYVICRQGEEAEAERIVRGVSKNKFMLKRGIGFREALDPVQEWDKEKLGWLNLDNDFLFFVDQKMWEQFTTLFKLFLPEDHPSRTSVVEAAKVEEPHQEPGKESQSPGL